MEEEDFVDITSSETEKIEGNQKKSENEKEEKSDFGKEVKSKSLKVNADSKDSSVNNNDDRELTKTG